MMMILDTQEKIEDAILKRVLVTGEDGIAKADLEKEFSILGHCYVDAVEKLLADFTIRKVQRYVSGFSGLVVHYAAN